MAFLDDLRRYLERPDAPTAGYVPDVAAHRAHLVNRLAELEKAGWSEAQLLAAHRRWTPRRTESFARAMGNALLRDLASGASAAEIHKWVDIAIDRELAVTLASTGTKVLDWEIDRLSRMVSSQDIDATDRANRITAEYALRIRAVRQLADRHLLTPIGKLILELPERDAIRWLLAAEVVQSLGRIDTWRLSRDLAAFLLRNPSGLWCKGEDFPEWMDSMRVLSRLTEMGVLTMETEEHNLSTSYKVPPAGRVLLEEIATGRDTPFVLLVQALLQDETTAVVSRVRPAGMAAQTESSVEATGRHARMVAHEIRNALVPVQSAVESLYRDLERQGAKDPIEKRRDTIEDGIERVFRFLRDISKIADLASAPSDLFDLTSAVQDAIAAFGSSMGLSVPFEQTEPLPAVKGHRDRFVLALLNVLRNAAQARPADGLRISVSAGTHNGAEVFVAVDDNGPGVPAEHRTNIFEPGFSLRPDGTGQGLALVREVIEVEMAGRAICEQSDLGGARIVLRLPVGAKRNKS